MRYAGFWRRVLAVVIDGFVLYVVLAVIDVASDGAAYQDVVSIGSPSGGSRTVGFNLPLTFFGSLVAVFGGWLYFTWMESSALQATLGKLALGIMVTDLDGNPASFGRTARRSLAKFLSAITLMRGFLMAGTTPHKQALHDMIAGTLVIRHRPLDQD